MDNLAGISRDVAVEAIDLAILVGGVVQIVPTVMVGLYGWDTKDFIIGAHERLFDDNNDGEISRASETTARHSMRAARKKANMPTSCWGATTLPAMSSAD